MLFTPGGFHMHHYHSLPELAAVLRLVSHRTSAVRAGIVIGNPAIRRPLPISQDWSAWRVDPPSCGGMIQTIQHKQE